MKLSRSLLVGLCSLLVTVRASDEASVNDSTAVEEPKGPIPDIERASLEVDPVHVPIKSKGCKEELKFSATPGGESKRIKIGSDRYIRVTLPEGYKHGEPAPLILAFHDRGMSAQTMEEETLLSSPAYNKDAIVVYPEPKEDDRWLSDPRPPPGAYDLEFVNEVLDKLSSRLCIDEDRIYAVGIGTGGGMLQLMACSSLSSRIAAFSIVNGNILAGGYRAGKGPVKDPTRGLWDECIAYRSIVRVQSIHSENNTLFDYWGENRDGTRLRQATVEHLVEWANRNQCGEGIVEGTPWRHSKDPVQKTLLQSGYIFEGFIEEGAVIKASYHCWPGDFGKYQAQNDELNEDGSMKPTPPTPEVNDFRTVEEKMEDLIHRLSRNLIQEHHFIRNIGHGWHRVEKVRDESDAKRKEINGPLSFAQPATTWKPIPNPPDYDPDTSFSKTASTFSYGFLEPQELLDRPPRFDTTARVLQFLRMYRLSDLRPKADRNAEELSEPEEHMVKMFSEQFSNVIESKEGETKDNERELEANNGVPEGAAEANDIDVPMIQMGNFHEASPMKGAIEEREKDEL